MVNSSQTVTDPRDTAWFMRGFLLLGALWLVAQGHSGSFLSSWNDEANLPGNICWLLILYCFARVAIDWGVRCVKLRRFGREALLLIGFVLGFELMWHALGGMQLGLAAFFGQPITVLLGFATLHRLKPVTA